MNNLGLLLLETTTDKADAIAAKQLIKDLKKVDPDLTVAVQCGWVVKPIYDPEELDAEDYCGQEGIIQLTDHGGDRDVRLRGIDDLQDDIHSCLLFTDGAENLKVVCLDENGDVYSLSYHGKEDGCFILNAVKGNDIHLSMTVSDFLEMMDEDCLGIAINCANDKGHDVLRAIDVGPFGEDDDEAFYSFIKLGINGKVVVACRLGDIIRGEDHNSVIDTPGAMLTKDEVVKYLKNWYIPYLNYKQEEEQEEADDDGLLPVDCQARIDVLQGVVKWLETTLDAAAFYGNGILNYLKKGYISYLKSITEKENDKAASYNEDSVTAIECSSRAEALKRVADQLDIILNGVEN